jgi:rubrerythrin
MPKKSFKELSEREILALAIQLEEEDSRVYADFADGLRETYASTAKVFEEMQAEESRHRQSLIDLYRSRFGDHIPLIRRQDVKGFVERRPEWLVRALGIDRVRKQVEVMELETRQFYERALAKVSDASTRKLLGDLAEVERQHYDFAGTLEEKHLAVAARTDEDKSRRRMFMLQFIQPGLAGLMDGSVSTLAPIFAAAFATHKSHDAFLVGAAASIGAGISMAFAEALSDDGSLTGRGRPVVRGLVTGPNDCGRRNRAHASVSDCGFPSRFSRGRHCRGSRAGDHQLRAPPLYGYASAFLLASSDSRWRTGIRRGNLDREFLKLCFRASLF